MSCLCDWTGSSPNSSFFTQRVMMQSMIKAHETGDKKYLYTPFYTNSQETIATIDIEWFSWAGIRHGL